MKQDLLYFLPELVLVGTVLFLLVVDFMTGGKKRGVFPFFAFLGIAGMIGAVIGTRQMAPTTFFSGMVAADDIGRFFKILFGISGLLGILMSVKSPEVEKADQASYYTLLAALVLGMMLLGSANHLLMLYLALEMVSVLSYILTGSLRGVRRSSEAALKYVIYGGVASGIMAYGLSLLYGMTGTMSFPEIAAFLKANAVSRPALFASVLLVMGGLGFKIASFPFHMWCPDVYEGAPTPFTAFLSVGPKAAGFAALIRFFLVSLTSPSQDLSTFLAVKPVGLVEMLTVLSIATMTIGNLAALVQNNMKRLLAYSSIAHAGYLLMGFAALNQESLNAILLYLVIYLIMNVGAFLVVILVSSQLGVEDIGGYKGLGRRGGRGTYLALIMTVFMFSLTGIPPMAGFIGKFFLFGAVLKAGLYGLAIAGVLNSVVSLYYYVRVVKVMFFDSPDDTRAVQMPVAAQSWILAGLAGLTLYLGLFWNGLATMTARSTGLYASSFAAPAVASAEPAATAAPAAAPAPAAPAAATPQ